ncbi:MAG: DUF2520 domain-containing protein [Xanthomonadales bacterium]|jgi:predicted short-subunit dehydrogenase-like oxidoreductase (DUF2520 family)|nr:DUF2520 domain-containing protein [Xanthomonadales bacterium]MDH3941051.1 DUF2520 domain-containing protein [Xanthomonadales bacterium]MDH4000157.1 DUF2520 domain-containing protein [Xanthomonadales bacterium]
MDLGRINIIGCGRAAGSLARLWVEAGSVCIGDVINRTFESAERAVTRTGAGHAVTAVSSMSRAEYWLIGANDDRIEDLAELLADSVTGLERSVVFHLAGRFGLEVLEPLAKTGACLAALHPVRSLTDAKLTVEEFRGTACVAEGSSAALDRLQPLITSIGGSWLPVDSINRGLYHASVSIVSNITKAVAWKAQKWQQKAGLPAATAATVTHQLLQSTMVDLARAGAKKTITGPVVRGDTSTIEAHLGAIRHSHPEDIDVYRVLARTVLELAQERGDLDEETLQRFQSLFRN